MLHYIVHPDPAYNNPINVTKDKNIRRVRAVHGIVNLWSNRTFRYQYGGEKMYLAISTEGRRQVFSFLLLNKTFHDCIIIEYTDRTIEKEIVKIEYQINELYGLWHIIGQPAIVSEIDRGTIYMCRYDDFLNNPQNYQLTTDLVRAVVRHKREIKLATKFPYYDYFRNLSTQNQQRYPKEFRVLYNEGFIVKFINYTNDTATSGRYFFFFVGSGYTISSYEVIPIDGLEIAVNAGIALSSIEQLQADHITQRVYHFNFYRTGDYAQVDPNYATQKKYREKDRTFYPFLIGEFPQHHYIGLNHSVHRMDFFPVLFTSLEYYNPNHVSIMRLGCAGKRLFLHFGHLSLDFTFNIRRILYSPVMIYPSTAYSHNQHTDVTQGVFHSFLPCKVRLRGFLYRRRTDPPHLTIENISIHQHNIPATEFSNYGPVFHFAEIRDDEYDYYKNSQVINHIPRRFDSTTLLYETGRMRLPVLETHLNEYISYNNNVYIKNFAYFDITLDYIISPHIDFSILIDWIPFGGVTYRLFLNSREEDPPLYMEKYVDVYRISPKEAVQLNPFQKILLTQGNIPPGSFVLPDELAEQGFFPRPGQSSADPHTNESEVTFTHYMKAGQPFFFNKEVGYWATVQRSFDMIPAAASWNTFVFLAAPYQPVLWDYYGPHETILGLTGAGFRKPTVALINFEFIPVH